MTDAEFVNWVIRNLLTDNQLAVNLPGKVRVSVRDWYKERMTAHAGFEFRRGEGIKVAELVAFLDANANPKSEVWFEGQNLSRVRRVCLDVFNPGSRPVVVLYEKFDDDK